MKRLPSAKELQNKILIVSVRSSDEAIVEQKPEEVEEIDEYAFYGEVKRKRKPGPRNVKEEKAKKRLTLLPQWSKLVALEYITFTTIANMKRLASPWRLFNIGEKSLLSALERHPAVGDTGQRHERQAGGGGAPTMHARSGAGLTILLPLPANTTGVLRIHGDKPCPRFPGE